MAKIAIDLTGRGGLGPGFQGDLNDTSTTPNLRYMGGDTQVADGIYDPLRVFGYMAPANGSFADLTGTITNEIVGRTYDSSTDTIYMIENTEFLATVSTLTGTSVTETSTIGSTGTFKDIELYQVNGERAIVYTWKYTNFNGPDSVVLGFKTMDTSRGAFLLAAPVYQTGVSSTNELIIAAGNDKLAQKFSTSDFSLMGSGVVTGVRIRIGGQLTQNFTVGIQTDSAGRPSGSYVTNGSVTLPFANFHQGMQDVYLTFATAPTLTGSTTYHLVVEPTNFAGIGTDSLQWLRSTSSNSQYANGQAEQHIAGAWADATGTSESFDFAIVLNNANFLTGPTGTSAGSVLNAFTSTHVFTQKADNGFMYIFADNQVHKFDGGVSGGNVGTSTTDILEFPKFLQCVDAADTNSLMYIGIQSTNAEAGGGTDYRNFPADTMGIYQWDRLSTVANTRNFIPIYGAREIKRVYVNTDGDLRVITIGEDRFTEIRGIVNGKLVVLQKLPILAYPPKRDSVDFLNNMLTWIGADGIVYAYGKLPNSTTEQLYKFGKLTGYTGTLTSGVLLVGNSESTQSRDGVFITYTTTAPAKKMTKWYPHGTGTINSVAQVPNQGDVYSNLTQLPYLSDVHHLTITCAPNGQGGGSTVAGTIKFYKNMETTPFMTKNVTYDLMKRGYLSYEINKSYVSAFQIEVEWPTSATLGANDFLPAFAVLDYTAVNTVIPK